MGDALAGGTLYHMYCARLIHAMGGTPGTYASTEEGQAALKFMESISIHEVREKIKYMIKHKYQRKVLGTEDTQTLEARKRSLVKVLSLGEEYKETLAFIQSEFVQHDAKIRKFTISMQSEMMKMTDTVRMVVDKVGSSTFMRRLPTCFSFIFILGRAVDLGSVTMFSFKFYSTGFIL